MFTTFTPTQIDEQRQRLKLAIDDPDMLPMLTDHLLAVGDFNPGTEKEARLLRKQMETCIVNSYALSAIGAHVSIQAA
ncbi:MAG TPA: hypothetical protein VGL07_16890 [Buttiauxella sp.]|jgi:hypothetical protein